MARRIDFGGGVGFYEGIVGQDKKAQEYTPPPKRYHTNVTPKFILDRGALDHTPELNRFERH